MLSKRSVLSNFRKGLQSFLREEFTNFNANYDKIEFTDLAFSYDSHDHSFSFSLNTAFDRNKAVLIFKQVDEDMVRKNPKHWRYQDIALHDLIEEEHFEAYFTEEEFESLLIGELQKFLNSHAFKALKKADTFNAYLVHDEPFSVISLMN